MNITSLTHELIMKKILHMSNQAYHIMSKQNKGNSDWTGKSIPENRIDHRLPNGVQEIDPLLLN